jgi:hypothetical protein
MLRFFNYAYYADEIDLTGVNLLGLPGVPRSQVEQILPTLCPTARMARRLTLVSRLRAYNGEIADEIHAFRAAHQEEYRLMRILLRQERVIGLVIKWD